MKRSFSRDFSVNKSLYVLMLPVLLYFVLFFYVPMGGAVIAFQDFTPGRGFFGSDFVGFDHFADFFSSFYLWRVLSNTVILSVLSLLIEFPAAIILALLINELRSRAFAGTVKTLSYLPHFVSLVVVCGMVKDFTSTGGFINTLFTSLGYDGHSMLEKADLFRPLYILSGLWQNMGWDSIIYLAALSGIDQEQYEAARVDGANRWRQLVSITIPGILPVVVVMLLLRIGNIMNVGFEKVILLYNPITYETSDIISTFVYRKGLLDFDWSYSTAVGLFNSVINFVLLFSANRISRKVNNSGLW